MYMKKEGYVIPTTMIIIATAIALLTSLMQRSFYFQETSAFEFKRQRVRLLAMSGIQIAMAQIALILPKKEAEEEKKQNKESKEEDSRKLTPVQEWILQLMPIMNTWQTFKLTEESDGIVGEIKLYIACEQGKFNISQMYGILSAKQGTAKETQDKKNEQGKQPAKKAAGPTQNWAQTVSSLLEKSSISGLSSSLTKFKEKMRRAPDDPLELLDQEVGKMFKDALFPTEDGKSEGKKPLYLMDLFTAATKNEKLNPWLLSSSVCSLLGLNVNREKFDIKSKIKEVKPFTNWSQQWNKLLEPLYGKKYDAIAKEISALFAPSFDASICSVICRVESQGNAQKVYAVLEKTVPPDGISPKSMVFKIKRMYWL